MPIQFEASVKTVATDGDRDNNNNTRTTDISQLHRLICAFTVCAKMVLNCG